MFMKSIVNYTKLNSRGLVLCCFLLFVGAFFGSAFCQNKNFPFEFNFQQRLTSSIKHRSLRPYNEGINQIKYTNFYVDSAERESRFYRFVFKKSVLDVVDNDVTLKADPLFNFAVGNLSNNNLYRYFTNSRGFRVLADLGKKVSFETRFYENQMIYPEYLDAIADQRGIGIGIGRSKPFKDYGLDAATASGYISYSPNQLINFQFGHGRHFFGNGYRSLLLSDYAPNYPYLSGQYLFLNGKLAYKHITAWMHSRDRTPGSGISAETIYKRKASSFNLLSFSLNENLEFSFFEGVIHKSYDENLGTIHPDFSFYLPVFGSSILVNYQDSKINRVYGASFSSLFVKKIELYGQTMLHESANLAFQSGIKWLAPFQIKNSYLLMEYNYIKPFSYTVDSSRILQTYTHNGHELAHPLGSGVSELIIKGYFEYKKFLLNVQFSNFITEFSDDNQGADIFLPHSSLATDLVKHNNTYSFIELGYLLNVQTQMKVFVSFTNRTNLSVIQPTQNYPSKFFFVGFRTNLINNYYDQ